MKIPPGKTPGIVVEEAKKTAREYMRSRRSFAWNATNTTRSMRLQLIDFFAGYNARIRIVYREANFDELLRRNRERTAMVPEKFIHKLAAKLDIPDITEAHQVQWVIDD